MSQATHTTETTATNATLPFPPAGLTRFRSSEDNLSRHRPTGSTRHTSRGLPRCAFERCNEPPPREVAPKNPVRLLTSPSRFLSFAALSPIRLLVPASPARPSGFASEHFNAREAVVEAWRDQRRIGDKAAKLRNRDGEVSRRTGFFGATSLGGGSLHRSNAHRGRPRDVCRVEPVGLCRDRLSSDDRKRVRPAGGKGNVALVAVVSVVWVACDTHRTQGQLRQIMAEMAVASQVQALAGQEFGADGPYETRCLRVTGFMWNITAAQPAPWVSGSFGDAGVTVSKPSLPGCRVEWTRIGQGYVPSAKQTRPCWFGQRSEVQIGRAHV